jgi:peptidylprolyl isomerase
MKIRIFSQVVALCALSMGLQAQDEPAPPVAAEKPAAKPDAAKPDAAKPDAAKPDAAKPDAAKPPVTTPAPKPVDPALVAPDDVAAPPADAGKSDSGLAWKVIKEGTGTSHPSATERVEVHYTGWKTDGEMFDSSVERGQPTSFALNGVIKGWTEGVQLMVEGEKRRFWIPGNLAYGEEPEAKPPGERRGPPLGMLCFDIELLSILRPHDTPENLTAAPEDATVTDSGLATKLIKPGTGEAKPKPLDNVQVHYTLWTTDGKMLDTTLTTGQPKFLPLKRTIKGFTEALQMMVEGETRRLWIPVTLAYGSEPPEGAPKGMLVFEVELVKIFSN